MESLTLLAAKDEGDLLRVADDDAFWFELGETEKAAFRPTATAMMTDGMQATNDTFGLAPRIGFEGAVDLAIRNQVDSYLDDWWLALSNNERIILRGRIANLAAGKVPGGFPQFRKSIEDLYGVNRGRLIAETETTRLWALGSEISMEQSGVKEYVWRTVNDDRVDEDCAKLNGTVHQVGGQGERPPKHPRCRCAIIPVPPDLELEPGPVVQQGLAPPLPPVTVDAPVAQIVDIAPLGTTKGSNKAVRLALDRGVSRNLAKFTPRERELLSRTNSHMRIGAGQNAGENEFGGRIGFSPRRIKDWITPYGEQPSLLTAAGEIGQPIRRGFLLIEHELTHGMVARSRSINFTRAKPRNAATRDAWRKRRQKNFGDRVWTDDDIDHFYAAQRNYGGGGKSLEEGTTEVQARRRLRATLQDEFGLEERAAQKLVDESAWSYAGPVAHIEAITAEAVSLELEGTFARTAAGRLANVTRLGDDFSRSLANEVAPYDRSDVLARFFSTKWTAEFGPVAGRTATGELIGINRAEDFYQEIKRVTRGGRAVDRLPEIKARWKTAADDFAERLLDEFDPLDPVVIIDELVLDATNQPPIFKDLIPSDVEVVISR